MRPTFPRSALVTTIASTMAAALAVPLLATPAEAARARRIDYHEFATKADFRAGTMEGVRVARGRLRIGTPLGVVPYLDPHGGPTKRYDYGVWTSPWTAPGFGLTELIPSWDVTTKKDTWVQVAVRGRTARGRTSSWDTVARWAAGDRTFHRTSTDAQTDDLAWVNTDTFKPEGRVRFADYQIQLTLFRKAGTRATPRVDSVGAMASRLPDVDAVPASEPGPARGITLKVPKYSQMIHDGDYAQFGGGGEAWCSPTSTSMVLGYYDRLPPESAYSWVPDGHRNRFVDHAARMTYDYEYQGTGNWPFNTAFASQHADHAFVTRLRSLREAERFIKAGIPVIASVRFYNGALEGAPIKNTDGHLMVIVGFTQNGDVVVNDPAAKQNKGVRRIYDRGQFENAWIPTSGGLSYIIRTRAQELPPSPGNW